jgi:ParB family chromosome partitioning protein
MLVYISKIQVKNRIRKDYGDINSLAQDIEKNGLIEPIVVTPDYILIAGERRLMALKQLGDTQTDVSIINIEDYEHELNCQISENECRKDFTPEERAAWGREVEQVQKIKALEREKSGKKVDPGDLGPQGRGRTRDIVAQKVGFGSGRTYERAKYVVENGPRELIDKMNKNEISIRAAFEQVKSALGQPVKQKEDKPDIKQPAKLEITEKKNLQHALPGPDSGNLLSTRPTIISVSQIKDLVYNFLSEAMPYARMFDQIQLFSEFEKKQISSEIDKVEQWIKIFRNALQNKPMGRVLDEEL